MANVNKPTSNSWFSIFFSAPPPSRPSTGMLNGKPFPPTVSSKALAVIFAPIKTSLHEVNLLRSASSVSQNRNLPIQQDGDRKEDFELSLLPRSSTPIPRMGNCSVHQKKIEYLRESYEQELLSTQKSREQLEIDLIRAEAESAEAHIDAFDKNQKVLLLEEKIADLEERRQREEDKKNTLLNKFLKACEGQIHADGTNGNTQWHLGDFEREVAEFKAGREATEAHLGAFELELAAHKQELKTIKSKLNKHRQLVTQAHVLSEKILICEIKILNLLRQHSRMQQIAIAAGSIFGLFGTALSASATLFIGPLSSHSYVREEVNKRSHLIKARDKLLQNNPILKGEPLLDYTPHSALPLYGTIIRGPVKKEVKNSSQQS